MITVFGSINVDLTFRLPHLPAVGETVLTPAVTQAVGGKGANQAIAAARDGAATRFIGCVGADDFGATARTALADLGIDVGGLKTVAGATGLAAVWVDGQGRNQIAVASGANAALKAGALAGRAITPDTIVVLQMETPAAQVEAVIGQAARIGAKVVLNLAPALPLPPAALRQVEIVVLNDGVIFQNQTAKWRVLFHCADNRPRHHHGRRGGVAAVFPFRGVARFANSIPARVNLQVRGNDTA